MPIRLAFLSFAIAQYCFATGALAITVGEQDDFSTSLEGWGQGGVSTPTAGVTRVSTGGPAGAGDGYMQVAADGLGDHGGLVAFNHTAAWTGDYLTAGVTSVRMDVNNFGGADLSLRLAFGTSEAPSDGGTWLSSTTPISLSAGSGWTEVEFPVAAADLTRVLGSASHAAVLSGVATLRLLHSETPNSRGPFISALLGVDNMRAVGSISIPGDFDGNLIVDMADLAEWRSDFGENGNSDADGDGDTDGRDLLIWQRQLGATAVAAIPEPAAFAMALAAILVAIGCWRRQSKSF